MSKVRQITVLLMAIGISSGFHDCIQASNEIRRRRRNRLFGSDSKEATKSSRQQLTRHELNSCSGGICVGMTNGPHEGGNASYPVRWNGTAGTSVHSIMTVPELPKLLDGITYYLWTDVFFGDGSLGRMNQMVPQLLLGSALDSSSGPPLWEPIWHTHQTWAFGAHYFFETANPSNTSITEGHAAYGELYPAWPGETLYSNFDLVSGGDGMDSDESPKWILTMGVVGDPTRISKLVVERPYMGIGATWKEGPTTSWAEKPYRNMCINACWELYGASDALHLPASGANYELTITQPVAESQYPFTTWVRDEGNGKCPSCQIVENHDDITQRVRVAIDVANIMRH